MATIAIGDIHGNLAALDDLLARLLPEVGAEDTLVFLGDYIDRGPDVRGCIERILELKREGRSVVALLGNHEQWMLRSLVDPTRHSWFIAMEAYPTVASYSRTAADALQRAFEAAGPRLLTEGLVLPYHLFFDALPPAHLQFFQALQPFYQADGLLCSHGGADLLGKAAKDTETERLIWGATGWPEQYVGTDKVVYGHWDSAELDAGGWPRPHMPGNRTFGVDTVSHGVLTALRFPDLKLFQSARHRN